jgi:hypothetical protein
MPKKFYKRRSRIYSERRVNVLDTIERFLIVCEGEKTEPNYFKSFRVPKEVIDVRGFGFNTTVLVEKALELKSKGDYDQVWCVFDRNSFPAESFNKAIVLARQNNIRVAYSNEAFELWYLLHFNYYNTAISRSDYITKLSELLGCRYEKNSETIYEAIERHQNDAIRNAQKLLEQYSPPDPARDNPSTTVHLLVEQLNRFVR